MFRKYFFSATLASTCKSCITWKQGEDEAATAITQLTIYPDGRTASHNVVEVTPCHRTCQLSFHQYSIRDLLILFLSESTPKPQRSARCFPRYIGVQGGNTRCHAQIAHAINLLRKMIADAKCEGTSKLETAMYSKVSKTYYRMGKRRTPLPSCG